MARRFYTLELTKTEIEELVYTLKCTDDLNGIPSDKNLIEYLEKLFKQESHNE